RPGRCAVQHPVAGEFGEEQVAGDTGEVEHQRLPVEPAGPRLGDLPVDGVRVPVVHVDAAAVDGDPGAAVGHPASPGAEFADLAGPAEGAQVVGAEHAPVVDGEVPVAVRAGGALRPGAARGHRLDAGQAGQPGADVVEER